MGAKKALETTTTQEWVRKHNKRLKEMKERYDASAKATILLPGERVLVHTTRRKGHGKLAVLWEEEIQVVIGQPDPENPTYKIRPEGKVGPVRIVHRNRLRICPFSCPDMCPPTSTSPREETPVATQEDATTPTQQWLLLWSRTQRTTVINHQPATNQLVPVEQEGPRRSTRKNLGRPPARFK